jgi:hypothetical protein
MYMSRKLTKGCTYALYSNSIGVDVSGVNPIDDYWAGATCSILFLSKNSKLVIDKNLKSGSLIENWIVVLVDDLSEFVDERKACKVSKLSPTQFLAKCNTCSVC